MVTAFQLKLVNTQHGQRGVLVIKQVVKVAIRYVTVLQKAGMSAIA
jgi:hypothetical protein